MLTAGKEIAIIGGGPRGLTLARLLQLKGATVKVFERDVHQGVRIQGVHWTYIPNPGWPH